MNNASEEPASAHNLRDDDFRFYALLASVGSWIVFLALSNVLPGAAAICLVLPFGWISAFIARRSGRVPFKVLGWACLLFWTGQLIALVLFWSER